MVFSNRESTKQVLELPVMVDADDLKGGRDPFDTQI